MTGSVVPAVSLGRRSAEVAHRTTSPATQPIPLPPLPSLTISTRVYGFAVMDCHGRLADRATLRALAWAPGCELALSIVAGSVLAVPDPDGLVRVGTDGYLRLPIGLRRRCRISTGARVLLAADLPAGRLLLYPGAALDALLDAHDAATAAGAMP